MADKTGKVQITQNNKGQMQVIYTGEISPKNVIMACTILIQNLLRENYTIQQDASSPVVKTFDDRLRK